MTRAVLDDSHDTMDAVYSALQRQLGLPAHFGRNLDALWDVLTTDLRGPVEITWKNHAQARAKLGPDYERLIRTLREVERARKDFRLKLE